MNLLIARGQLGLDVSTLHPHMARDNRRTYKSRFPYCGLIPIHRHCILVVVFSVVMVYVQWGSGL